MNTNLEFEFLVNKEENTITIKREFDAELSLVWDAYTKSEILDQWWAPKPWKARTKKMDFREGGQWLYAMVGPNNEEHWGLTSYNRIESQKNYKGKDCFCDKDGIPNVEMPESSFEVTFTPKGTKTLVEFIVIYGDLAQLEATIQMGFKEGLTMAMEGLDELLPTLAK